MPEIRIFTKAIAKSLPVFADKFRVTEKRRIVNEHMLGFEHITKYAIRFPKMGMCTCCMFDTGAKCDIMPLLGNVVFVVL